MTKTPNTTNDLRFALRWLTLVLIVATTTVAIWAIENANQGDWFFAIVDGGSAVLLASGAVATFIREDRYDRAPRRPRAIVPSRYKGRQ